MKGMKTFESLAGRFQCPLCTQTPRVLAEFFSLQNSESDPRAAVLLELYFYTLQFCRDQKFSREQTSCFFSIVKETHQTCMETPLGNMDRCYSYFTELLMCHAARRPPFSIDLFNQEQVLQITEYVVNTYFRHFKLYKYAYTPQVRLDISLSYIGMEVPEESRDEETPPQDHSEGPSLAASEEEEKTAETVLVLESDTAPLKEYIRVQLNEEVSQLRSTVEGKLRENEENFSAQLATLEEQPVKKSAKGKRK
ncbi:cilia- and flagella-associated protein 119 isoform X2 [Ambystoma mexicanum]|uniref:cilia- and flagella-associated protein 119 isoform X2 n=1 Tax=Ambystoma mexicanum TaxID=8296 RepID=UPI0037E71379